MGLTTIKMGLTTILRGFKVPIAILDRFLESNGVRQTYGFPPIYDRLPLPGSKDGSTLDPQSAFLRTKLPNHANATRIFIPNRQGMSRSTHAYIAYTYVMVFGQRQIDLAAELPADAPPGFAELRREILGFVGKGEERMLQVAGMQAGEEGGYPASGLFVVVTDQREYPWKGPFMREVSFFGSSEPNYPFLPCCFCPFSSRLLCTTTTLERSY